MKRILISSAVALATLAGAASAMNNPANQVILERYAPNIDVSTLTDVQVATLLAIVSSGDSATDKRTKIRSFVN